MRVPLPETALNQQSLKKIFETFFEKRHIYIAALIALALLTCLSQMP
jgi:hypothetical protein